MESGYRMAANGVPAITSSPGSTPTAVGVGETTATGVPAATAPGLLHVSPGFQHSLVTPSPYYNNSIASTGWSSKPAVLRHANIVLRSLGFFFSAAALLAPIVSDVNSAGATVFRRSAEFRYLVGVNSISTFYCATQLFKCVWDIAFKNSFISDSAYDYITFGLDQTVTFLLLSSSSVSSTSVRTFPERRVPSLGNFKTAVVVAICMSFMAFVVIAMCSLFSGYKLCKRISW